MYIGYRLYGGGGEEIHGRPAPQSGHWLDAPFRQYSTGNDFYLIAVCRLMHMFVLLICFFFTFSDPAWRHKSIIAPNEAFLRNMLRLLLSS